MILNNYPVTYSFIGVFLELRYENITWNLIQIRGLNQEISYSNLPQVISRAFQVIWNSFWGGFMAWFWTIIQWLIHLSAYFWSCSMKMLHGIWYKLEDWIKRYLIQTYHRLSQEYIKSYRIAFRVALWLDFEQLSTYLFVYRRFYRATLSKCHMEFDTNWRNESRDILFKLDFGQLSSYLFVYWRLFRVTISKCYMKFDTKLEDWIKRYLI